MQSRVAALAKRISAIVNRIGDEIKIRCLDAGIASCRRMIRRHEECERRLQKEIHMQRNANVRADLLLDLEDVQIDLDYMRLELGELLASRQKLSLRRRALNTSLNHAH